MLEVKETEGTMAMENVKVLAQLARRAEGVVRANFAVLAAALALVEARDSDVDEVTAQLLVSAVDSVIARARVMSLEAEAAAETALAEVRAVRVADA